MKRKEYEMLNKNTRNIRDVFGVLPDNVKYSPLEKRAAKELYYQLGEERSLEKVYRILGINISTLKEWSTVDGWAKWAEARQKEDDKLALKGKYSTQILGLNAKAKAYLEQVIEWSAERLSMGKSDLRASDGVNAAKELMRLTEADKQPDLMQTAVPIVIILGEDKKVEAIQEKEKKKEIVIEAN